ncbi:hypothetical protein K439DRAFT_1630937 [Ramaria rubella]|nr:hypothetical protein K439DRAFT_1630937 [Ramaria rubella]
MQMVKTSTSIPTWVDIEEQYETPILIESITDEEEESDSLPGTWSQIDLTDDIPLDFKCMLSLPQPASVLRLLPTSQTDVLARGIMKNAIIRDSLIRQLRLDTGIVVHAPIPRTRLSDESPHPMKKQPKPSAALLRAGTRINTPQAGVSSKQALRRYFCSLTSEGFPKRVTRKEASLHDAQSIPNSFFKGELSLSHELANTIDWPGIYFVEASVFFRNNVVLARRP